MIRQCTGLRLRMRRAFSLIEMLVVLAISMLIMMLLAMAYDSASRAMRLARSTAEISSDFTKVETILRSLLRSRHFEGDLRVSELDPNNPDRRPRAGFFAVIEGRPEPTPPGLVPPGPGGPPEGVYVKDGLNFTVRLIGNSPSDFFETSLTRPNGWNLPDPGRDAPSPPAPPTIGPQLLTNAGYPESRYQQGPTYRSQWAEIAIFLSRQPEDPTKRAATVPVDHPAHPDLPTRGPAAKLYRLHIRKLLLAPTHFAKGPSYFDPTGRVVAYAIQPQQPWPGTSRIFYPDAYDLSLRREVNPGYEAWVVNTPTDVQNPANRFCNPNPPYRYRSRLPTEPNWDLNELPGDWPDGWPGPLRLASGRQGEDVILNNVVSFDVKVIQGGAATDGPYDSTSNQPLQGVWIRIRVFNPKTQQMRDLVIVEAL